jgi:DNA-directed RNA polymerase specialized sigma24 family protein
MGLLSRFGGRWGWVTRGGGAACAARVEAVHRFQTTRWSLVQRAGQRDAREALASLCQTYWQPVHSFIRAQGIAPQDAEDLTQGLFASILARGDLARVDPERGRFRSWLRQCARHYVCNYFDHKNAPKAGGGVTFVDVHGEGADVVLDLGAKDAELPDRLFDQRWALTVVDRALQRLEAQYVKEGRGELFARLRSTLSGEANVDADGAVGADAEAPQKSPRAIRVARHRLMTELETKFRRCLRAEIAETLADTVSDPAAIDDEMRELFNVLC